MCAVTRDLYLAFGIVAALATVLLANCHGAPACRMGTLVLNICHDELPFLSAEYRDPSAIRHPEFAQMTPLVRPVYSLARQGPQQTLGLHDANQIVTAYGQWQSGNGKL